MDTNKNNKKEEADITKEFKQAEEKASEDLIEDFKQVRKKINDVRKACDTILDAAEEALKLLMK